MQHPELGQRILERVADAVAHLGKVEAMPKLDGRNMVMVLAPDKRAKAAHDKAQAEAAAATTPAAPAAAPEAKSASDEATPGDPAA